MVLGGLVAAGVPLSTGGLLVRVNPSAPLMFGAAGLLLTGVALLAGDLAARRTIRVDPVAGRSVLVVDASNRDSVPDRSSFAPA